MSQMKVFDNPIMELTAIRMVEIEVFSYCNRKCWFCPNSFIDRSSSISYMDEGIYNGILKNLAMIKFQKTISYSRYNEPLADPIIFTRVEQARKLLPKAYLHFNTNGDYLTRGMLEKLRNCGLNSLKIQHYLSRNENFNVDKIKESIEEMSKKLEIPYEPFTWKEDKWYGVKFAFQGMDIFMYARDFRANGNNRGNSLKDVIAVNRVSPCYTPFTDVYIDYNGSIMPCCNLRSDYPPHQEFIMGNLHENSLIPLLNSRKYIEFRKKILQMPIDFPPCNSCNFNN